MRSIPALAGAIAELHSLGYVHGDVKFQNAVVSTNGVRLCDFELAERIHAPLTFHAGTPGCLIDDGIEKANPLGDTFALGASIATCVLGADVASIPGPRGRLVGLLTLFNSTLATRIAKRGLSAIPEMRPSAHDIALALDSAAVEYANAQSLRFSSRRPWSWQRSFRWCWRISLEACFSTRKRSTRTEYGLSWND